MTLRRSTSIPPRRCAPWPKWRHASEQINSHIGQISDRNIQVATATEEQSSVVEDINRNIVDINELTVGTTHIADQLNPASSDLQALSTQLDNLVGRFRL